MANFPAKARFYMPAEWEKHEGTWLQWPHDDTYEDHQMRLEHVWLAMTWFLHEGETVHIAVADERREQHIRQQMAFYGFDRSSIDVHIMPTDDVWVRDNGPIFVVNDNGEIAATDWRFNGWGGRHPFEKDRTVPAGVAGLLSIPLFQAPIVLEGGAIDVNGKGSLLATRTSIMNPNRNPEKSEEEIEEALRQYLGIKHIIWLSGAPKDWCDQVGDDTDFHVDLAARFVSESTVLYSWTDDESHPSYPYLKQHQEELREATTESGKPLTLIPLPLPRNRSYSMENTSTSAPFGAKPALATYTNYYVANQVVLVPVYGDVQDAVAKAIIGEHFPNRKIIGIPAQAVAELGGMMHCVTQQQPVSFH